MAPTHQITLGRQANNSARNKLALQTFYTPSHLELLRKRQNKAAFNQRGLFG